MDWENLRLGLARSLAPEIFVSTEELRKSLNESMLLLNEVSKANIDLKSRNATLVAAGLQLQDEVDALKEGLAPFDTRTELEIFCDENYKSVPMVAYEGKRLHQDKPISVFLNQMITPDAFEVKKFKKGILEGSTLRERAVRVGNKVAKEFTWTSDSNLSTSGDYYLYPEEIIVTSKGDCEDHAYAVSSIDPRIGVAYGFMGEGGHAFNCFVENGKLYILETTANIGNVKEYDSQELYKIHFIITKNKLYQLKYGVSFGKIAGWDD